MIVVPVKEGENIEKALKKFKRKFEKTGVIKELRNRQLDRTKYYSGEMTTPGEGNQYIVLEYGDREWSKED